MVESNAEKKRPDWDQDDVLETKDGVTTNRGLQLWGDDVKGMEGEHGTASEGTAERSARITSAQRQAEGETDDEPKEGEPGREIKEKHARGEDL